MTPTEDPAPRRPSARQLSYLRVLSERTGQTFAWPTTRAEASREIRRLKAVPPSTSVERDAERHDRVAEAGAREANCDAPIGKHELQGYGSTATWKERS